MHILMVTNNYSPYSGGVVSSINATVAALQQCGHQVTLVTFNFSSKLQNDPAWVRRLYCPVTFRYKKNYMAIAWRAKKQIKQLIKEIQPDLVHVHHPFLLGKIAARIAKSQATPVYFTYHTIYEAYVHYVCFPEFLAKLLVKRSVLSFCKLVDGIIAPSSEIKKYLAAEQIKTPVEVLPSGLQKHFCMPESRLALKKNGPIKLLTVGRMVKEKNIESLLHVAQMLKQKGYAFTFTLVGYGSEYEALQRYAFDQLKLSHQEIIFVHQPPKDLLVRHYLDSDLFLFASHTDTQGLVLAEAMACGLPVIALDGPGQRDIIEQEKNGYIVATDQKMADCIGMIIENVTILQHLSGNAYKTAQRYHPDFIAQRLIALYSSRFLSYK